MNAQPTQASIPDNLLEPAQSLVSYTTILIEDARERPATFIELLNKLHLAGQSLLQLANSLLMDENPKAPHGGVHHAVGNRLQAVKGYCEILLLEEEQEFFGRFNSDLQKISRCCGECEQLLLLGSKTTEQANHVPRAYVAVPPTSQRPIVPGKILIIDDNADSRDILASHLREHDVSTASSGREALDALAAQDLLDEPFDLALLDLHMPDMDGFEVIAAMKANPRLAQTSLVVISCFSNTEAAAGCIAHGVEDYLTKPVAKALLHAAVDSVLEKRRLKMSELEQFFPRAVARQLLRDPSMLNKGLKQVVTVLFVDIRGFSRISEKLNDPSKMVAWLSAVMEQLFACVIEHSGVVVDFVGDEVMAMWGAPEKQHNQAQLACQAALEMLRRVATLNAVWEPIIGEPTRVGIGINTGVAHVGNSGTVRKFKYGPLGNTVNLASRVQGATKYLKADILITAFTHRALDKSFAARKLSTIHPVNINKPVELFEIREPGEAHWDELRQLYEQALKHYESQELTQGAELLGSIITRHGAKGPELALLSRTIECLVDPSRWRAVWELPGK